mgnify:CR=1 FL=1
MILPATSLPEAASTPCRPGEEFTSSTSGLVGPTGDVIPYTLYANNSTSFPITRGVAFDFARNGILDLLGLLNGTTPKTVPLYVKTNLGANVAAGLYQETLTIVIVDPGKAQLAAGVAAHGPGRVAP